MTKLRRIGPQAPKKFIAPRPTGHFLYLMDRDNHLSLSLRNTHVNPKVKPDEDELKLILQAWIKNYPTPAVQNLDICVWSSFVPPPTGGPGRNPVNVVASLRVGQQGGVPEFFFSLEDTGFVLLIQDEEKNQVQALEQFVHPGVPIFQEEADVIIQYWQSIHPGDCKLKLYSASNISSADEDVIWNYECEVRRTGKMSAIIPKEVAPPPQPPKADGSIDGVYGVQ